jgi:hypothetical protein
MSKDRQQEIRIRSALPKTAEGFYKVQKNLYRTNVYKNFLAEPVNASEY